MKERTSGRVTIPTDVDVVPETLDLVKRWGADAIRDCDGTDYPEELKNVDAKVYSTYYTTRKDNAWAKANPEEIQQMYIMTPFYTAVEEELSIHLMNHLYPDMLKVNDHDDITRWWEVIDRTTGEAVPTEQWSYDSENGDVTIHSAKAFHDYTVSFLAYIMWDPVHMYNAVTNGWTDFEKQITFDVRQPKTHKYSMERLRKYIQDNPHIDVIRYTTFFHQFTLIFDELARERYVDWYGYSASVSPYILEQFEQEVGYKFRPEFIIDQGYMNNTYRIPSKEFKDFQAFQRREVAKLAKEMVDITHECGKEAMMFLGDHWIGMEPFMDEFKTIGLDAVVGSVGNGATLRLISDIDGVKYTEGRFLPYFFPDTFHEGGDPVKEAKVNWVTARRAILRKPIDRIGYGGYLKLAMEFPEFIDYVESVCNEFRTLYTNIKGTTPYCIKKVAVLNCWGKMRAWGNHMVHHAIYYKQNYSYAGVIEALSGAPFDVRFISFDDICENPAILDDIDVVLNIGDADTAYTGGDNWTDETIVTAIKKFVYNGGGFIGANSATPIENPTILTNLIELYSMMLLPGACVITFGKMVRDRKCEAQAGSTAFTVRSGVDSRSFTARFFGREGRTIFAAMSILFVIGLGICFWAESQGNPALAEAGLSQSMGSMEGKEVRFGVAQSAMFTTTTTSFTTGTVNNMHDTLTPLGGMIPLLHMMLNVVFGGKGVGLMNMIMYAILAVFICGLMIGRTPEYLGKKIEGREMKLTALCIIIHPFLILAFSALAVGTQAGLEGITNPGFHGLSQVLYEFSSSAANNGSGFEGLADNTYFWNITTGLVMFLGRYLPIVLQLAIAGSLMKKSYVNESAGTLQTSTVSFSVILVFVVYIFAALTFFPALALGPIAEHLTLWG